MLLFYIRFSCVPQGVGPQSLRVASPECRRAAAWDAGNFSA